MAKEARWECHLSILSRRCRWSTRNCLCKSWTWINMNNLLPKRMKVAPLGPRPLQRKAWASKLISNQYSAFAQSAVATQWRHFFFIFKFPWACAHKQEKSRKRPNNCSIRLNRLPRRLKMSLGVKRTCSNSPAQGAEDFSSSESIKRLIY